MKSSLKQFGGLFCSDSPTKMTPEQFPASSQFSFLFSGPRFSQYKAASCVAEKVCGTQVVWHHTSNVRDHAPPQTESSRCRAWIAGGECCRKIRVGRRVVTSSSLHLRATRFLCFSFVFLFVLVFVLVFFVLPPSSY